MSRRAWVAAAAGLIVVLGAAHRHQDPPDPAPDTSGGPTPAPSTAP